VANSDNDSETVSSSKEQPSELGVTQASTSASGSVNKQEAKSLMKSKVADGKKRTTVTEESEKEEVGNSSSSLTVDVHSSEVGKDKSVKTSTAPSPQTPLQKLSAKMANISRCKFVYTDVVYLNFFKLHLFCIKKLKVELNLKSCAFMIF
jgi:hypothetical protein